MLVLIGAAVALVVSEDMRKALLDKLFGAEEEFEYTSTTRRPEAEATSRRERGPAGGPFLVGAPLPMAFIDELWPL